MNYKNTIYRTMPAVATTTFIDITSEDVGDIISYMKMLIGDLMPLLSLVVAVGIGLIIIAAIIRAIRG